MQSFIMEIRKLFESDDIDANTILKDSPWWDSMAFMDIITLADEKYSVILDADELRSAGTVADLFAIATGSKK